MMNNINALVVEDVEIAQKIAKLTLMGLGCRVDIAEDGRKALQLYKENKYDIIFMDIGLPDINGLEVTKKIREIEFNNKHMPVIALTANCDETDKPRYLAAGIDEIILKPITKENSQAMIDKYMHNVERSKEHEDN